MESAKELIRSFPPFTRTSLALLWWGNSATMFTLCVCQQTSCSHCCRSMWCPTPSTCWHTTQTTSKYRTSSSSKTLKSKYAKLFVDDNTDDDECFKMRRSTHLRLNMQLCWPLKHKALNITSPPQHREYPPLLPCYYWHYSGSASSVSKEF